MLFVPQNMVVPQQALLKQAGVQVLAFEANSLRALTQRVQQTAAVLGPDAQQKALAYQRYFDRNVALVTGRLKDLPASQRVSLYHSMGNPLTTTGRPSLNQDWIDLAGGKISLKIGLASINKIVRVKSRWRKLSLPIRRLSSR